MDYPHVRLSTGKDGKGTVDWGTGHIDSFSDVSMSALQALGAENTNLKVGGFVSTKLDEPERFFIAADVLHYN